MNELFLNVFNATVMAAWTVLAVLVLRLLLHKAPAWIRCALWGIVGLRLIWPFRIESPVSLIPSTQTLPATQLYDYTPELNTGINALDQAVNPGFSQTFEAEISNSVNPLQIAVTVAGWIWFAGMAVMAVYALVSYLRLRRRVAVRMPVEGNVYLCDRIPTPFILGIIKPKIHLPSDLPEDQWPQILAHENAHLKRRDHWWKPLGFVLLTVHWFNPLLWVAYILLCRDIERACDEKVIAALTAEEKKTYSETLLACSTGKPRIAACPLAFGETGVKQRIKAVLHYKKPALWILIAAVLICAVTAVCFLTQREAGGTEIPGILINPMRTRSETELREQCPEYFNVSDSKGLEVHVHGNQLGHIYCYLLPGTNRVKTEEDFTALMPVSVAEMRIILDTYIIPRNEIFIYAHNVTLMEGILMNPPFLDYNSLMQYVAQNLRIEAVYVDSESFEKSAGTVFELVVQTYGRTHETRTYRLVPQPEQGTKADLYLDVIAGLKAKQVWKVYSVVNDPDLEVLMLISSDGTVRIYEWEE